MSGIGFTKQSHKKTNLEKNIQVEAQKKFENSEKLCEYIASISKDVIVSFSLGKDSIACYMQLLKYFKPENIHLGFYYVIPDLSFQNRSIEYYEQLWGKKIYKYPNPSFYRSLAGDIFQTPFTNSVIAELNIRSWLPEYDDVFDMMKLDLNLPLNTPVAVGVRQADSINRRITISQHGSYNPKRDQFYPVYDWSTKKVFDEIHKAKIMLPIDYEFWGRTFDGRFWHFIEPLRQFFPNDYAKIKAFFPENDLELIQKEDYFIQGKFEYIMKAKKIYPKWAEMYYRKLQLKQNEILIPSKSGELKQSQQTQ